MRYYNFIRLWYLNFVPVSAPAAGSYWRRIRAGRRRQSLRRFGAFRGRLIYTRVPVRYFIEEENQRDFLHGARFSGVRCVWVRTRSQCVVFHARGHSVLFFFSRTHPYWNPESPRMYGQVGGGWGGRETVQKNKKIEQTNKKNKPDGKIGRYENAYLRREHECVFRT